jgi:hypothetical protein
MPDGRAAIVKDAEAPGVRIAQDGEVGLGDAESFVIEHGRAVAPRRLQHALQAGGALDQVIVEKQLRAGAELHGL